MSSTLKELVERWYSETDRSDQLLGEILALARPLALKAAGATGLRDADLDDVAQHTCDKLARALARSAKRVENPDPLIWRIAENRARDVHRRRKRQAEGRERLERDPGILDRNVESPETIWLERERELAVQQQVRAALAEAPANYRRVIEQHYLEGVPIEEIAAAYYREMVDGGAVDPSDAAAAQKRARNRADQQLTRGRRWLQKRLADVLAKEGE